MPAEPKNTEQAGRNRRGLGNDRTSQLEVIKRGILSMRASSRSPGEEESKREVWRVVSPGRDAKTVDVWSAVGWNCGRAKSGPRTPSVNAVLNRHVSETTGLALDREAQGHVLIEALRRENIKVEMAVVIIAGVGECHIHIWTAVSGDVYVTGRPVQVSPGVIGDHLVAVIIGRDRCKHDSAAGIKIRETDDIRRKIWRASIKRIFKIKIDYQVRLRGWR